MKTALRAHEARLQKYEEQPVLCAATALTPWLVLYKDGAEAKGLTDRLQPLGEFQLTTEQRKQAVVYLKETIGPGAASELLSFMTKTGVYHRSSPPSPSVGPYEDELIWEHARRNSPEQFWRMFLELHKESALARVAIRVTSMPASTAMPERLFSGWYVLCGVKCSAGCCFKE
eukprot:Sspe_Gene.62713::Locus_35402_Transcript_1_1_Confidence_1.000_Length_1379::g.62713::m.62713